MTNGTVSMVETPTRVLLIRAAAAIGLAFMLHVPLVVSGPMTVSVSVMVTEPETLQTPWCH
jgi:hypothetical protein